MPPGTTGELYIGGAGVARGYLNRADLTAERFLDDPFSHEPGARMYRTGDLARWLPDGNLEFLGRNDHQVKIRGFRIELGEIEAQLASHPAVREAVIIARDDSGSNRSADKRLVAYVTLTADAAGLVETLRIHLTERLPDYMVPAAFVVLDALPLTPNGKLDRRALPDPQWQDLSAYVAPRTPLEHTLAQSFASVLGLERVGVSESFFSLGGHSLLATRLISQLRTVLDRELPLRLLFDAPTVAALAQTIEDDAGPGVAHARPPLLAQPRPSHLPLSFAQERLWFLEQLAPGQSTYHIPVAMRLNGSLDVPAFHCALNAIVARHESLRTCLVSNNGRPEQRIAAQLQLALPVTTLAHLVPDERNVELQRRAQAEAQQPFDLEHGPLLRAQLLRLAPEEHVLLFTMHHLISDGWSAGVLVRELGACYTAFLRNEALALPPLPVQYVDYTLWQRGWLTGAELERQTQYWRNQLADLAPLDLPTDRPRPAQISGRGATLPFALSPELSERLNALANQEGVTPFMLLLAVFQTLLARLSGQTDVAVGSPIAGRTHASTEALLGLFVNTLVLRADLSGTPTLRSLLAQVRDTALAAYAHQDLPFEKLVEALAPVRDTSRTPLFQVMFLLQNAPMDALALPGLTLELLPAGEAGAKVDLTLSLAQTAQDGLAGSFGYATDLFDEATVARLGERFTRLLEQALDQPDAPLHALEFMLPEEHALLERWNDTAAPYPEHLCIHQLFEQQVRRTPEATALVFEGESLTYAQLNARANRLAHHLIGLGVRPETRVALCMARSAELIAALLAILKAGGAYVPLDPAYPGERLAQILDDVEPALLVADAHGQAALRHTGDLPVFDPVSFNDAATQKEHDPTVPGLNPRHLAYVIYTSGSTGKPKGVMIEHGSVLNLLGSMTDITAITQRDRMLCLTTVAFDMAVPELYLPLVTGAALVLIQRSDARDPAALQSMVEELDISIMQAAPSTWRMLLDAQWQGRPGLTALCGSEALPGELATRLAAKVGSLCNLYGPTETTVWSTSCPLDAATGMPAGATAPIGRPIANTLIYLLDVHGELVPPGAIGELYIGGTGVARGYLNRADLTAERFLDDPFSGKPDARMYRTGDLARWLPDGNLEFLGRNDHQVKIRGFRIELGEIEAQLISHPAVREAVVIARDDSGNNHAGDKHLVAYVTLTPGADAAGMADALRTHLTERLPDYMVPAAFVVLDALPLTPNGKLDRRALPAPQWQDPSAYVAPRTPLEHALAQSFASVLGLERVGVSDNFFSLGGHSLLAVRLAAHIQRSLGQSISVRSLFEAPTVAALAARMNTSLPSTEFEMILPFRTSGTRPALFCVHPVGGLAWSYSGLANVIGPDHPIYGLQTPVLSQAGYAPASIEEIASHYVARIRQVQPLGPYRLLGWSFGGLLAFAMATQLQRDGQSVEQLIIMDAQLPGQAREPEVPDEVAFLMMCFPGISESLTDALRDAPTLSGRIRLLRDQGLIPSYVEDQHVMSLFEATRQHVRLLPTFIPGQYSGDLLYFTAARAHANRQPHLQWLPHISGQIHNHDIDCGHADMCSTQSLASIGSIAMNGSGSQPASPASVAAVERPA
ncbi:non-ribosomal peptide synthetase [Caballeronia calidae]|uniref:Non-ribosomal peptide synthetase n=2 Tax=Caballeronia calidae TaxID=1777139 RepID=A0A158BJJ4_9BURK|nr:non-ribosomal peptide synthetase [Caballeronia calidae]